MTNVDNTQKPFTAVEWFFGYGGNHLGLRMLGNGVYPACAEKAFVTLLQKLNFIQPVDLK